MEGATQIIFIGLLMILLFSVADKINEEVSNVINLPVNAVIVKGELGSERSGENVAKLIENVNKVWLGANVSFELKSIETVQMSPDEIKKVLEGDGKLLVQAGGYDPSAINLFLVKNMSTNGISFPEHRIVIMPDKTTNLEQVAASHELGHVLGLSHNPDEDYLMYTVCNDTKMAPTEVFDARKNAKDLGSIFNSYMVLPAVSTEFIVAS